MRSSPLLPPAAATTAAEAGAANVLKANKFVLVDGNGRMRAILSAEGGPHQGPALVFDDPSGTPKVRISADEISIGSVAIAPAGIHIGPAQAEHSFISAGSVLLIDPDGHTYLNIWPHVIRIHESDSSAFLSSNLIDIREGQGLLALSFDKSGNPSLLLADEKGRTRAQLGAVDLKEFDTGNVIQRSPASLVLFNENGHVLWKTP
jgi:hypothetical protein